MKHLTSLLASFLVVAFVLVALVSPSVAHADVDDMDAEEIAALTRLNEIRAALGLEVLDVSPILTAAAEFMANDMAEHEYLDHTDSLGRDFGERISEGFDYEAEARENILYGSAQLVETGAQAIQAWQDSPGHRHNNEAEGMVVAGIARVEGERDLWYWALLLGGRADDGTITLAEASGATQPPTAGLPDEGEDDSDGAAEFEVPLEQAVGLELNVWTGGSVAQLAESVAERGARSVWVAVDGAWVSLVPQGLAILNAPFVDAFPDGVPEDLPVLLSYR